MKPEKIITVTNAEGQADTSADLLIANRIDGSPKVSVIIPVYNVENYLRECLDSVINQSLKDIEIICVDDGSTDSSLKILKEYAAKDRRITVITQPNTNAGVARNAGLTVAKGEYIGFVDSDDYLSPDMYEKLYTKAAPKGLDISVCQYRAFDSESRETVRVWGISMGLLKQYSIDDDNVLHVRPGDPIFQLSNAAPWNKIYKREHLVKYALYFQAIMSANDVAFTHSAFSCAQTIGLVCEELYHYRSNTINSLTIKRNKNPFLFYEAIKELHSRLEKRGKLQDFWQSFFNIVASDCIFNYGKVDDANKVKLIHLFAKELFPKYNFSDETLPRIYASHTRAKIQELLKTISDAAEVSRAPKVSVIIPVYNVENYLHECLDSLISQSLKHIEIICVDDGSTDHSLDILREYEQKDPRVKILTQKNQKQGAARNNALKLVTGEYVQFLDSDDYLAPNTCESLYKKCKELNLDMLSFGGTNFDNDTREILGNPYYEFRYLPDDWSKEIFCYKDCTAFLPRMAVSAALTIYRRQFLKEHRITFPEKIYYEDNTFFVKAVTQAKRVSIDKTLYYYRRIHPMSTTHDWSKHFGDYLKNIEIILRHLKDIEMEERIWLLYKNTYTSTAKSKFKSFSAQDQKKYAKALNRIIAWDRQESRGIWGAIKAYLFFPYYCWKLAQNRKKANMQGIK